MKSYEPCGGMVNPWGLVNPPCGLVNLGCVNPTGGLVNLCCVNPPEGIVNLG